jgi:hypothetical protein
VFFEAFLKDGKGDTERFGSGFDSENPGSSSFSFSVTTGSTGAGFEVMRLPDCAQMTAEKVNRNSKKTMNLLILNLERILKMNFLHFFDAENSRKV